SIWAKNEDPEIRKQYKEILDGVREKGGTVYEVPMEEETLQVVEDPYRGKNMWCVGVLAFLYRRDMDL
ncbi:MAG: hypothetical protein GTO37_04205, partial [Planctomycetales bacterium]|nr:hypothetical protein [Planctomycetales bacterium]NIP68727.1 hypothetical protein [Planctomycetales bacterium]